MPFDELFVLQDTLRLDPSMLIGQVGFLDISARDEILVTDHVANSVYLFWELRRKVDRIKRLE